MKTIQIDLPTPIVDFIHSLKKDEEAFTKEAIEEKIIREKRHNLESLLKEGYVSTANEDLTILNDFSNADFENL